ncbi:hypothetical protein ACLBWS_06135 [Brucellaceae bacterium D45D]
MHELHRTPNQTKRVIFVLVVVSATAAWSIWDGVSTSGRLMLVYGIFLTLWAAFIALNLIRRRTYIVIGDAGLTITRIIRSPVVIEWSMIETIKLPNYPKVGIIGWKERPDGKLQYTGVSQRIIGEEGADSLRKIIFSSCPDVTVTT